MTDPSLGDIPPDDYEARLQRLNEWVIYNPAWINTKLTATKVHAGLYGLFPGLTLGVLAVIGPPLTLPVIDV